MDDDIATRLIREIEAEKGRLLGHEAVCSERYKNITDKFADVGSKLDKLVTASEKTASRLDGRVIAVLVATVSFLVGLATWEAKQLYVDIPQRAAATSNPFSLTH